MSRSVKQLGPLDRAVVGVIRKRVRARGLTHRQLVEMTGLGLNRIGIIFREETPPITMGEMAALAGAVELLPSSVMAEAEARVSDLDPTMYALAARADDDDDEAAAQQIDP